MITARFITITGVGATRTLDNLELKRTVRHPRMVSGGDGGSSTKSKGSELV